MGDKTNPRVSVFYIGWQPESRLKNEWSPNESNLDIHPYKTSSHSDAELGRVTCLSNET